MNVKKLATGGRNKILYKKNGVKLLINCLILICHGLFVQARGYFMLLGGDRQDKEIDLKGGKHVLIKCEECGADLLVDGVEKLGSKEVSARVDNYPNYGAPLKTKKEKIDFKSRNLEQVRRMSVDKRPKRPMENPSKES